MSDGGIITLRDVYLAVEALKTQTITNGSQIERLAMKIGEQNGRVQKAETGIAALNADRLANQIAAARASGIMEGHAGVVLTRKQMSAIMGALTLIVSLATGLGALLVRLLA